MILPCTYQNAPDGATCGASTGTEATHAVIDYNCMGYWTIYSRAQLGPLPPEIAERTILFCARHAQLTADNFNRELR
jgi:hypothetical protein